MNKMKFVEGTHYRRRLHQSGPTPHKCKELVSCLFRDMSSYPNDAEHGVIVRVGKHKRCKGVIRLDKLAKHINKTHPECIPAEGRSLFDMGSTMELWWRCCTKQSGNASRRCFSKPTGIFSRQFGSGNYRCRRWRCCSEHLGIYEQCACSSRSLSLCSTGRRLRNRFYAKYFKISTMASFLFICIGSCARTKMLESTTEDYTHGSSRSDSITASC